MKHLEKIVFLIVLLIVGGLAYWALSEDSAQGPDVASDIPPVSGMVTLASYSGVPPSAQVQWPEPLPQDEEGKWLYRVFTPPVLYIVDGRFDPVPPLPPGPIVDPVKEEPFGVALTDIQRNQYRLQLDAIYETRLDDVESAVLSFENVYASQTERPTISIKKGETNEEFGFRVEDIRREETRIGGGLEREHIATITDLRTGKTVLLSDQNTLFEEGVALVFESTINPSEKATANEVGQTFQMNEATYTISEVNLDNSAVQLVKESEKLEVPEVKTLTVQKSQPVEVPSSPSPEPPPEASSESTDESFESLFN